MKKTIGVVLALAACGAAWILYAAQDTALDGMAEVRDPVRLKAWLETNASDAETRVAALEGGSTVGTVLPAYIIVGNASSQGVDVAVSGDATLSTAGVLTLADNAAPAAQIGAGTFPSDVVYSNASGKVTAANVVAAQINTKVVTMGTFTNVVGSVTSVLNVVKWANP